MYRLEKVLPIAITLITQLYNPAYAKPSLTLDNEFNPKKIMQLNGKTGSNPFIKLVQESGEISSQIDFNDFAFPEFVRAIYSNQSRPYTSKPLIPLAYIAGISEALNDQGMLFLVKDPRSYIRELDPGLRTEVGRKIATNPNAVREMTQKGLESFGRFFKGMADARRRGATIQEELAESQKGLLGKKSGMLNVKEAKEFGIRDGRTLALLYDENLDGFRKIYSGLIRFVHNEVK